MDPQGEREEKAVVVMVVDATAAAVGVALEAVPAASAERMAESGTTDSPRMRIVDSAHPVKSGIE